MGFMDTFNNMTPFDEIANAGMAAGRKLGRVAGQGAYGLGRMAGTGVGTLGSLAGQGAGVAGNALSRMAGMGADVAQGVGRYGMQGAELMGRGAIGIAQQQADQLASLGRGIGGAAMGAGRGFMDGVTGAPGVMADAPGRILTTTQQRIGTGPQIPVQRIDRSGFMNALRAFSNRPRYNSNGVPLR